MKGANPTPLKWVPSLVLLAKSNGPLYLRSTIIKCMQRLPRKKVSLYDKYTILFDSHGGQQSLNCAGKWQLTSSVSAR